MRHETLKNTGQVNDSGKYHEYESWRREEGRKDGEEEEGRGRGKEERGGGGLGERGERKGGGNEEHVKRRERMGKRYKEGRMERGEKGRGQG